MSFAIDRDIALLILDEHNCIKHLMLYDTILPLMESPKKTVLSTTVAQNFFLTLGK